MLLIKKHKISKNVKVIAWKGVMNSRKLEVLNVNVSRQFVTIV